MSDDSIDRIVEEICSSPKYRKLHLCSDTVRDLIENELRHHSSRRAAVKAARRKLHRAVATYLGDPDFVRAKDALTDAVASADEGRVRDECFRVLETHVTTRERLEIADEFYSSVFELTGRPQTVLDVACGLNPLFLPWMRLPADTRYVAYDFHDERIALVNHFLSLMGLEPLGRVRDVIVEPPSGEGDVALLLKTAHTWEPRRRGSTARVVDALDATWVVVSYPTRSISGRHELADVYRESFGAAAAQRGWDVTELVFSNELAFCVRKERP